MQVNCDREGFNVNTDTDWNSKARIGFLGNQQHKCSSSESRIGFGTGGYPYPTNTCGNTAMDSPDNGDRDIRAVGCYILVQ